MIQGEGSVYVVGPILTVEGVTKIKRERKND